MSHVWVPAPPAVIRTGGASWSEPIRSLFTLVGHTQRIFLSSFSFGTCHGRDLIRVW